VGAYAAYASVKTVVVGAPVGAPTGITAPIASPALRLPGAMPPVSASAPQLEVGADAAPAGNPPDAPEPRRGIRPAIYACA
jgi:hypothetical protein